jgi:hypothetical protein
MAQTAVDYLVKKFHDYGTLYYSDIAEAKSMEKEQIEEAYNEGFIDSYDNIDNVDIYYNKRYTNGL